MLIIVDYQMGNVGSVLNMLKKIGCPACVSRDAQQISQASKLVLPGVGAFDTGMRNLAELGLIEILNQKVKRDRTPILGICLGMQLLSRRSEEGMLPGLGWLDAETRAIPLSDSGQRLKIPHMGWNTLAIKPGQMLFEPMPPEPRFYFVHSYHVVCDHAENIAAVTHYGLDLCAAVCCDNICGVQFHPEKSHKFGMQLLTNFVRWGC